MSDTMVKTSDLRQLVAEEIERNAAADPKVIAASVAAQIEECDLRSVVEQLLPDYVRVKLHQTRSAPLPSPVSSAPQTSTGSPRSRRWEEVSSYQERLRERYHVPGNGWKFLGDITPAEAGMIGEDRISQSKALAASGENWLQLQRAMTLLGADNARELAPTELMANPL